MSRGSVENLWINLSTNKFENLKDKMFLKKR